MSFHNRHTLHGRIVHAKKKEIGWPSNSKHTSSNMADEVEQPILLYVHHLSPVQRLLNRSTFNFFTRQNISASSKHIEEERDDLIKVELGTLELIFETPLRNKFQQPFNCIIRFFCTAGIKQPTSYSAPSFQEQEGAWLSAFAQNQSYVTFQLITRRVVDIKSLQQEGITKDAASSNFNSLSVVDRLTASPSDTMSTMLDKEQTAICKVYFRPSDSIFRKDLATSLVQFGRAEVLPSGLYLELKGKRTTDRSDKLADIQSDVSYMGQLVKAEYSAIKEKKGLWANDNVRERKENFIKEVLADELSLWKKIWSWLKERIA